MSPDSSLLDGLGGASFRQRLKMLPAALFLAGNSQLQLCCAPLSLIKGVPSHTDKCLRDALGAFAALPQ